MKALKANIVQAALSLGFDAAACASVSPSLHGDYLDRWLADGKQGDMQWLARDPERRKDIEKFWPGAKSVVVVALNYWMEESAPVSNKGIVARYARGRDYHKTMERMLRELAKAIETLGGEGAKARISVDTSALLEREYAKKSGLAWVGKSTMALNRQLGTWFLLGEVVMNLEIEPDVEAVDRCGTCTRCINACPTQAITAPYELDARRCISYLTIESKGSIPEEFRSAIGNRIFGCDDCLTVCPWNRFAREAKVFKQTYRADLERIDPRQVLRMSDDDFSQMFSGTPIRRLGQVRLQRNACVVLGNVGQAEDVPLLESLARDHPDPMVREHAEWAVRRVAERRG